MVTAAMVKELRETTGAGMLDCQKALKETDGNMEKAIEFLREKGLATAAKKAGRIAAEGIVKVYVNDDKTIGVLLEVNSETDFVAKNEEFQSFVTNVAKIVADKNPTDVEALKALPYENNETVGDKLTALIAKIGENMNIRRFKRVSGNVCSYTHGEGRIGVLVETENKLDGASYEAAHDVAMQIAAINPMYLSKEYVPAADVEKEKAVIVAQIKEDPKNANKPDNIIEKMVGGKINKFYEQNCLLQQEFVKDSEFNVESYLTSKGVKLNNFVRFEKGEGLQKREENFADEVMKQIK
ncbi:MAG: elongation factor Ts [Clostridia bacterium]|nr:elongation factor Ts [Clostridia bacterium]